VGRGRSRGRGGVGDEEAEEGAKAMEGKIEGAKV